MGGLNKWAHLPAPIRYYGAKWALAEWIIGYLPEHDTYGEPFGGSGAVLLRKKPSAVEIYNDFDDVVVNFFRVVRDKDLRDQLMMAIELTPFARAECDACIVPNVEVDGPVEAARKFYVSSWQGRGMGAASQRSAAGWRFVVDAVGSYPPSDFYSRAESMLWVAERMKHVQIEHGKAFDVIDRYDRPGVLWYLDPPYSHESSSGGRGKEEGKGKGKGASRASFKVYRGEMNEQDHGGFLHKVASPSDPLKGMVVISGYDNPQYTSWFESVDGKPVYCPGWKIVRREAVVDRGEKKVEVLWISPNAQKAGSVQHTMLEEMMV